MMIRRMGRAAEKAMDRRAAPNRREVGIMTGGTLALTVATFGRSVAIEGIPRTAQLLALGLATASAGELAATAAKQVAHRLPARVGGVPLILIPGWYVAMAAGYHLALAALPERAGPPAVGAVAALAGTAADLAADPLGLANAYWVWPRDGGYARSVVGDNGRRGVPWGNYAAWLLMVGAVAGAQRALAGRSPAEASRRARRWAPLTIAHYLSISGYALVWGARTRRWDVLVPSLLGIGASVAAALRGYGKREG
jgi:uncharacterized membrane protein